MQFSVLFTAEVRFVWFLFFVSLLMPAHQTDWRVEKEKTGQRRGVIPCYCVCSTNCRLLFFLTRHCVWLTSVDVTRTRIALGQMRDVMSWPFGYVLSLIVTAALLTELLFRAGCVGQ